MTNKATDRPILRNALVGTVMIVGSLCLAGPTSESEYRITFDHGTDGWSINGWDVIDPNNGNPGANVNINIVDTFGLTVRNDGPNEAFVGNYFDKGVVRMGLDVEVNWILFGGIEVSRELVVELRDYDNPPRPYPWVSVWYNAGQLPAPDDGWQTFVYDIALQEELPPGWGGTGAEDPVTFEPTLPPGRTYGSVLRGVDEVVFTTFVPGWFYGFTNFNIRIDNIFVVTETPEPCPADANGDDVVNYADFSILLIEFGQSGTGLSADFNGDLSVDLLDFSLLLVHYGSNCM